MKMYFYLQFKRAFKLLPFVMVTALILFSGLTVIFNAFMKLQNESESNTRFKIGIAGDAAGTYLDLGMAALQNFDSSRFAIEMVTMTEAEAANAIEKGDISAYVVIPEGFIEAALYGEIRTIKYVTTPGSVGLISIFKDEITAVISDIVEESQKGVYGIADALDSNGCEDEAYRYMNKLNIEYIDFVLDRSGLYKVEELGIADGLSLPTYIFCGITVLFLFLTGLPYATLFVKKDISLNKVLSARGNPASKQVISEYLSFFVTMSLLFTSVLAILAAVTGASGALKDSGIPQSVDMLMYALQILPVVALVTSCSFMIFELSGNLVSGMLLQFFTCLSLCYISGCLYPIYAFPISVQRLAVFLPTGMARSYLAGCLTGKSVVTDLLGMTVYLAVFLTVTVLVRRYKIVAKRG